MSGRVHLPREAAPVDRVTLLAHPGKERPVRRFLRALEATPGAGRIRIAVVQTRSLEHAEELVRAAAGDGTKALVVGGGDGLFMAALNGLADPPFPLLVPPMGTSNDFARAVGLHTLAAAASALVEGHTRLVDRVLCRFTAPNGEEVTRRFASSAGVGLVAAAFRMEDSKAGRLARRVLGDAIYAPLITWACLIEPSYRTTLVMDGVRSELETDFLELPRVGDTGGFALVPWAKPDSGSLEGLAVRSLSRRGRTRYLLRLMGRRHVDHPSSVFLAPRHPGSGHQGPRTLSIHTDPPAPVQLHGEWVGTTPAHFEIMPGTLRVLVPAGTAGRAP